LSLFPPLSQKLACPHGTSANPSPFTRQTSQQSAGSSAAAAAGSGAVEDSFASGGSAKDMRLSGELESFRAATRQQSGCSTQLGEIIHSCNFSAAMLSYSSTSSLLRYCPAAVC